MTTWTPSAPYAPGDIVTAPAPAGFTAVERIAVVAAALIVAAVMAFGMIHVAPNRHLFPANETYATLGLYWAAILLFAGVWLVARGRQKMRAAMPWRHEVMEYPEIAPDLTDEEVKELIVDHYGNVEIALAKFNEVVGYGGRGPAFEEVYDHPATELQRHLTAALAVMLRHPNLTVDAGTMRLLSRGPKPVRDEKGRWRRVQ